MQNGETSYYMIERSKWRTLLAKYELSLEISRGVRTFLYRRFPVNGMGLASRCTGA